MFLSPVLSKFSIEKNEFPQNYTQPESDEILFQDKTDAFLKYKKVSLERHKTYKIIFNIVKRCEMYTNKPLALDKADGGTLRAIEEFFRTEHTLFKEKKLKYRTTLVPITKYKYVWDYSPHERAPKKRSDNAIVTYMSAIRAYWRLCIDMGYTKNDPFRK